MADLTVTATDVVPVAGAYSSSSGIAGATITAGQVLYLDAVTTTLKLADNNVDAATAAVVGVALHGATSGQPIEYATSGSLTFSTMVVGETYIVSGTAGAIAPVADISTGRVSYVGYASTATNLVLTIRATGVVHA